MFKIFRKSLRNILIVAFILVGFIPYTAFFVYMLFLSENKIVQKSISEQYLRIDEMERLIDMHLSQLNKEVIFLSRLELMDDIVTEDIDKRLTRLLEQKAKDLELDAVLYILDTKGNLVASSTKNYSDFISFNSQSANGFYIKEKTLYFYAKVIASFDRSTELGTIVLAYNLNNLNLFLSSNGEIHSFIISPDNRYIIGKAMSFSIDYKGRMGDLIDHNHLIVYKALKKFLDGWYIVYAVKKDVALAFLYDFLHFMLYMIPVVIILIIVIALKYSKSIMRPIEDLTSLTDTITRTQDFSTHISIYTEDEIAKLSNSFNLMLQMTNRALKNLEKENKIRLQRFIQLIDIFNSIMQTQNEKDCINVSLENIKELTKDSELKFTQEKVNDEGAIGLYVSNFESGEKEYFGAILLDKKHLVDPNERKFYESIAKMISLQLDRIHLIEKTMAASRSKSAFISNMSHELRTPLNAIIGFTQYLIAYEDLNEEQYDIVASIESSAQYLLSMINDILDIAKIESGKMEAKPEDVKIVSLVKSIIEMLKHLAEQKGVEFKFETDIDEDTIVKTDPKMFKQVVVNLVSNAVKFTAKGFIEIKLYFEQDRLYIKVKDTGIGISKENLSKLFSDFTQVENVMQKSHKGTGLGLSLSKKMAHILGGDVYLESEGEVKGTTAIFWISLNS
ncbi:ATP-binding protein [Hydrogenimonas thermophila]|uniref:histidine kinase n=1 Tax=Hydrogenimonas thermophila TaxID=223786 RepID=A0A1I5P7A0_9BACT|nr:ATP-binding protein [Hydrogenimonas thermophila]SFP29843.1 HAMP domain-containing protein [Hydrogenimonas thermophila]